MVGERKGRRPLLALWLYGRLRCLTSWLCGWRVHVVGIGCPCHGERWRTLWVLRARTLHSRKGLLLLGIGGPRHRLLRMLWVSRRRLRTLRSRRKGRHILLLPWSLLVIRRPLRVEVGRKLVRVHGSFILVGVQDHVEGEQHQEVGGGSHMDGEQRHR